MLSRDQIVAALKELDQELGRMNIRGEINIVGGTVMCLVFHVRESTKDIDAIMMPADLIQKAALSVSETLHLDNFFWINDAAKVFASQKPEFVEFNLSLSHLKVMTASAEYMFAMKALSARSGTSDEDDLIWLKNELKLQGIDEAYLSIERFYPKQKLSIETQAMLKDLFEE
jgi:hypothetical protein